MQQATFTISGAEFNAEFIEKISVLLNGNLQDFEFQIRVKAKESREDMRRRIEKAMDDVERGDNLIAYTPEEYETLIRTLSNE